MRGCVALAGALCVSVVLNSGAQQTLVVRNNHEIPYRGPMDFLTDLGDGSYAGNGAVAQVQGGRAHVYAALAPSSEITLRKTSAPRANVFANGPLALTQDGASLRMKWNSADIAGISLGLVIIPGDAASEQNVARSFTPLDIRWTHSPDGSLKGVAESGGFGVIIDVRPYASGTLDMRTSIVSRNPSRSEYVALVRRVVSGGARDANIRFNGRVLPGADSPTSWEGDFRYIHGVDWVRFTSGTVSLLSVNGFTPTPSVRHDTTWAEGSSFYVRERSRQLGDTMYFVSEIAGPNPDQPKKGYMAVLPYAAPPVGDTVKLKWRLALDERPDSTWAESQLRVFAGTRTTERTRNTVRASLGVPYTTFGMAYFPYSSFSENFDFYRVPKLTSENFWPTSPEMWKQWRQWIPRMQSDMYIIRSMGFDIVRLHHLELLQTLPRAEAFAFLDFYAKQARELGLELMMDTEGPTEWVSAVVGRYSDIVTRVEIENEVLIPGITPAEPARWKAEYAAAKASAPNAQAFFTGAGNNSMFERLNALGVPFDRVGLHAYKHGPNWKESWGSHALGTAGYATELGKQVTLGEFNWKDLTRLSPETRPAQWDTIYRNVLITHAIPEIIEFQFQEQIVFNTTVGGTSSRHYEPVGIDRRPKPEAFVAMKLMKEFSRPDAPVRVMPVTVEPVIFAAQNVGDHRQASFAITNNSTADADVHMEALAFDGLASKLLTPATMHVARGMTVQGTVELSLATGARPGAYHHFVSVRYKTGRALGWGVASYEGVPQFADTSVLKDRVTYAQGLQSMKSIAWQRPLAVVFGEKSTALELEEAYQLANTLQSATGRVVRISTDKDLPDSLATRGTVFLVGTAAAIPMVASTQTAVVAGKGTISMHRANGHEWIVLTGADAKGVEAAVAELELRFWPNAKDATIRITGVEKGAALGNRTGGTNADPP